MSRTIAPRPDSSVARAIRPVAAMEDKARETERLVREGLDRALRSVSALGVEIPTLGGQLLRPRVALSFVPAARRESLPDRFWLGCLAIQMVHEASLHHDDVIDRGHERRGTSTLLARGGPAAALLKGDALLTGAYRAAVMVDSPQFLQVFVEAVERTVHGELLQARLPQAPDLEGQHEAVIRAKSGELFGAAAALAAEFGALAHANELRDAGREIGSVYQWVDDVLDYCDPSPTGKPPCQDFVNRTWTWVLQGIGYEWFDQSLEGAMDRFFGVGREGESMADRATARLNARAQALVDRLSVLGADLQLLARVRHWGELCRAAVAGAAAHRLRVQEPRQAPILAVVPRAVTPVARHAVLASARSLGPPSAWDGYFTQNSRSFSFAARLFPAEARRVVRNVYAFCRFTDDLVDGRDAPSAELHEILDAWVAACRAAYGGTPSGIPLVDVVMGEMAARDVPFACASDLIEGVRMDIDPRSYATMDELRVYTHRVASVVGGWLTHAFGVHDPWILERAHALGHAMQLTNILRDVGEDLDMDRLYLPLDRLRAHGLGRGSLIAMRDIRLVGDPYVDLLEELMAHADESYRIAYEGMPYLPPFFQRPVAVATEVYRGIHESIRRNRYDNLSRRAYTSGRRKMGLAMAGLRRLRAVKRAMHGSSALVARSQVRAG